jgi:dipeptidyl aminopeptidase/acylaminoacyl peptidase
VTDGEIGTPAWQFAQARYAVLPGGRVVAAVRRHGTDRLVVLDPDTTSGPRELDLPFTDVAALRARASGDIVVIAGSPVQEPGVYAADPSTGHLTTLREPSDAGVDPAWFSVPEAVSFPSGPDGGRTAYALFYPPRNPDFGGPEGSAPPLIVVIHGGPTAAAGAVLNLGVQYWTTRGFAVVDVDYGGSSGYGRAYRRLLEGNWGVVDVEDCLAAAGWLAAQGRVDGERLVIRGGSAGGYTTLAALARDDTPFAAGADYFGVADLEALAADTHKFESRYLDRLIGPYPQARDVYLARSPLTHVEAFRRPLIVLQGSEDAVVPPKQSELIVEALRARRVPVAYLLFEGEQHGFRKAENIIRALEAELSFYSQVLGFPPAETDALQQVLVENL